MYNVLESNTWTYFIIVTWRQRIKTFKSEGSFSHQLPSGRGKAMFGTCAWALWCCKQRMLQVAPILFNSSWLAINCCKVVWKYHTFSTITLLVQLRSFKHFTFLPPIGHFTNTSFQTIETADLLVSASINYLTKAGVAFIVETFVHMHY